MSNTELYRHTVTLRNGRYDGGIVTDEGGVRYGSLPAAVPLFGDIVSRYFPETSDGMFIYVPRGASARFLISNVIGKDMPSGDASAHNFILLEDNASAEIIYEVSGRGEGKYNFTEIRRAVLNEKAELRIEEFFVIDESGDFTLESEVIQTESSACETVTVDAGSGNLKLDYRSNLEGIRAQSAHSALYIVSGEERSDINITVRHLVPDCVSDETVKGLAADNAEGSFTGLVYVAPDAQRTEAYQQSRNILLSDTARIFASPQLEIYADDVKCSHGTTVGQQDDEAVYYMRQRGLSEASARVLQMSGFMNDIISRFSDEDMRNRVLSLAEEKIMNI